MILCPCGKGQIEGKIKSSEGAIKKLLPIINCCECSDIYEFHWHLNWDAWKGSYWYGWKRKFKP